jgi:hypothetical protein
VGAETDGTEAIAEVRDHVEAVGADGPGRTQDDDATASTAKWRTLRGGCFVNGGVSHDVSRPEYSWTFVPVPEFGNEKC